MRERKKKRFKAILRNSGEAMAKLWIERGYNWSKMDGEGVLMWDDSLERDGPSWEGMFPELRLLKHTGDPWPSPPFDYIGDISKLDEKRREAERKKLQAVAARLRKRQEQGEIISVEADLAGARDALEKQIRRVEKITADPMSKIRSVLKVWVYEAEQAATADEENDSDSSFPISSDQIDQISSPQDAIALAEPLAKGLYGVRRSGKQFWIDLTAALSTEHVDATLKKMLERHFVPAAVAESMAAATSVYKEDVYPHLNSAQDLNRKRVLYEANLHRLLQDKRVMDAEEVEEMLAGKHKSSNRPVQADHYAEEVAPHIDKAENLTHAYALVLATQSDGTLDEEAVDKYRKKKNKHERDPVRSAWRGWGYLDLGRHTREKLPNLKRRIKKYAEEGIFPTPPEGS